MQITENTNVFPPKVTFTDVDPKFLNFTKACRVLPSTYFNEPNTWFTLKHRYEPGENKYFPHGGFEVYGPEGATHNYDLNQVIVHPFHLGMLKFFSNQLNVAKEKITTGVKGKRGRPRISDEQKKAKVIYVPTGVKRGRKALDPKIKAEREQIKAAKHIISGGKRGRPKKNQSLS